MIPYVEVITGPSNNQGKLRVTFSNSAQRDYSSFELTDAIRAEAPAIPEALNLVYGIGATTAVFGKPVSVALRGNDLAELRAARDRLKAAMRQRTDIKDVSDSDQTGVQEAIVRLNPVGEQLGLTIGGVMNQVRAAFFGVEAQSLQRGSEEVEVWLRYPTTGRQSERQLTDLRIRTPQGASYPLSEVATLDYDSGNLAINHLNGEREIRVEANVADALVSAPAVIAELESGVLADVTARYPSVIYSVEGQNRDAAKMGATAGVVMPVVALIMLGLIVVAFNSFSQAILTFALYPFALIGVMVGHWVHDTPLNVFSIIGTIALIGVFTNNSLVFVSTYNALLTEGRSFRESLREAAQSRFRPILLTTLTTVAGLAPLLSSNSLGAQFLKGPAIAMAYGLSFGLFNTLLLLPAVLVLVNAGRRGLKRAKTRGKATPTREEVEPAIRSKAYEFEGVATVALLVVAMCGLSPKLEAQVTTSSGPVLTLNDAISLALANNPELAVLAYDRQISRNNVAPVVAGIGPRVEVRGSTFAGYGDSRVVTIPLGPPSAEGAGPLELSGENYGFTIQPEANWLVYDGGRGKARLEQLRLLDEDQALAIESTREATVAQVSEVYLQAVSLSRQIALAEANIDFTLDRIARITRSQSLGQGNTLAVLSERANLSTDSVGLRSLGLALANVKRTLNLLMGRDSETGFTIKSPVLPKGAALSYDSLQALMLADNEDLRRARNRLKISAQGERLQRSSYLPNVQLYVNGTYLDQIDNASFLLENRLLAAQGGARLSYTIFDGGLRDIERQNARLSSAQAKQGQEAQRLALETQLRQAYAKRASLAAQVRYLRQTLPTAELAFAQAERELTLGQATGTQVREAQLRLLSTNTSIATKEVEVAVAEVELLRLTGGLVR